MEIDQNSKKCCRKLQKNDKINNNTHIKAVLLKKLKFG